MFLNNKSNVQADPLRAKLLALKDKLGELHAKQEFSAEENKVNETISDDANLPNEEMKSIQQDEKVVRTALELVGVDYDSLIRMDAIEGENGNSFSPYAQAVRANPAILDQVLKSEQPVLAALQVALGFKPYAEFTQKYGDDPQKIRDAIRDEMKGELSVTVAEDKPQGKALAATPFSASRRSDGGESKTHKPKTLGEIFNK